MKQTVSVGRRRGTTRLGRSVVLLFLLWATTTDAFSAWTPPATKRYSNNNPQLKISTAATDNSASFSSSSEHNNNNNNNSSSSMPWSQLQEWSLRDQVPKYTVVIPTATKTTKQNTHNNYVLWRTMTNEVVELSGYPIDFLRDKLIQQQQEQEEQNETTASTTILPFLDEYEFEASGGLRGRVYGVRGVADGTSITTSPIGENVKATLPKGFVLTEDESVAYELGRPLLAAEQQHQPVYSLDAAKQIRGTTQESMASIAKNANDNGDGDLVRLGGLTAILLGGALAVDMLSHHLTVNVFWV